MYSCAFCGGEAGKLYSDPDNELDKDTFLCNKCLFDHCLENYRPNSCLVQHLCDMYPDQFKNKTENLSTESKTVGPNLDLFD